jgi:hypothetical protein
MGKMHKFRWDNQQKGAKAPEVRAEAQQRGQQTIGDKLEVIALLGIRHCF